MNDSNSFAIIFWYSLECEISLRECYVMLPNDIHWDSVFNFNSMLLLTMKVIKPITAVCPSEDKIELEIELAYLNKRLEKLPMNTLRKIPAIKELLEYEKKISYDE